MKKIAIIFNSRTKNTEKMAEAIALGAKTVRGIEVIVFHFKQGIYIPYQQLADVDAIILGSPTYYHDISQDMKIFLDELAQSNIGLKDKFGAVFGFYGWSGEATIYLLEIMKNRFGMKTIEPNLRIRYTPNEKGLEECQKFGEEIARKIV